MPRRVDLAQARDFYVTVKNGLRTGFLLGPYASHTAALAMVKVGEEMARGADLWADLYAYGTASLPAGTPCKTIFEKPRQVPNNDPVAVV